MVPSTEMGENRFGKRTRDLAFLWPHVWLEQNCELSRFSPGKVTP